MLKFIYKNITIKQDKKGSLHCTCILYIKQAPVIYIHDLVATEMSEVMTDT